MSLSHSVKKYSDNITDAWDKTIGLPEDLQEQYPIAVVIITSIYSIHLYFQDLDFLNFQNKLQKEKKQRLFLNSVAIAVFFIYENKSSCNYL